MEPTEGGGTTSAGGGKQGTTTTANDKELMNKMEELVLKEKETKAEEESEGAKMAENGDGGGGEEGGKAKKEEEPNEDSPPSEEWEPRKRVRVAVENEGKKEEEKEEGKEEKEEGKVQRKSCVKDDNGFTYYKCRFCGLTFNFMTTLKAHERVHDIDQPYTCNKCGESFHFMCELEYHAKTHLAQKGYKCECGRTFFQYTDLLYHHHPGEDSPPESAIPLPVAAPIQLAPSPSMPAIHSSTGEFPTPEFMERGFEPKHQMRVWSDVRSKPYICQYCSKSYADSRGLAYHMYSHRGERMFNPRASRYLMCRNDNSYISSGVDLRDA